jgi:hypothetical protein
MRHLRVIAALTMLALGGTGWYFFRPERAFIDVRVSEGAPHAATSLASGSFTPGEHKGMGMATVLQLRDGSRVVRFTGFETLNGPDVRVYLLGSHDVRGGAALRSAGFVDLGPLKGNVGDQSYVIPSDVDLRRYRVVAVWCRRFGVNFTQAILSGS